MSVYVLYYSLTNMSNGMFIYIDLITITPLAVTMSYTCPSPDLRSIRPPDSLMSLPVLASIFGHSIIQLGGIISVLELLKTEDWYSALDSSNLSTENPSAEATVVFIFSCL
jgi:cation-transporting ATPase 13A2